MKIDVGLRGSRGSYIVKSVQWRACQFKVRCGFVLASVGVMLFNDHHYVISIENNLIDNQASSYHTETDEVQHQISLISHAMMPFCAPDHENQSTKSRTGVYHFVTLFTEQNFALLWICTCAHCFPDIQIRIYPRQGSKCFIFHNTITCVV